MNKQPEPTGFPTIKIVWDALPPEMRQLLCEHAKKVWGEPKQASST